MPEREATVAAESFAPAMIELVFEGGRAPSTSQISAAAG
jgi:hypothetical protein